MRRAVFGPRVLRVRWRTARTDEHEYFEYESISMEELRVGGRRVRSATRQQENNSQLAKERTNERTKEEEEQEQLASLIKHKSEEG